MSDTTPFAFDARLGRRALLRNSLLALGAGAVLAACGDREGSTDPGRIGVAAPLPTLPATGEVTDATWLRTLQSLEHSMIALYAGLATHGGLPAKATGLAAPFQAAHVAAAETLAGLVADAGGADFACANPFFADRYVNPVIEALDDTDDRERDAAQIAYSFEDWAARSYQAVAARTWSDPALRAPLIGLAAEASRRAGGLALTLSPDTLVSPVLTGGQPGADNGFPVIYAIPFRFGQISPIELRYGKPNDDGAYRTVSLQTPADNALVYDSISC
ncbi:MAG TPA: hypothetical protein VNQ73_14440 [Ilumatobacter sp.]|nr:hypothetical protein [Ilumatobacter sp.]